LERGEKFLLSRKGVGAQIEMTSRAENRVCWVAKKWASILILWETSWPGKTAQKGGSIPAPSRCVTGLLAWFDLVGPH